MDKEIYKVSIGDPEYSLKVIKCKVISAISDSYEILDNGYSELVSECIFNKSFFHDSHGYIAYCYCKKSDIELAKDSVLTEVERRITDSIEHHTSNLKISKDLKQLVFPKISKLRNQIINAKEILNENNNKAE